MFSSKRRRGTLPTTRLAVGALLLLAVLVVSAGWTCADEGVDPVGMSAMDEVHIIGVEVSPSVGTGKVEVDVRYEWYYDGHDTSENAAVPAIECNYMTPNGSRVTFGYIWPSYDMAQDAGEQLKMGDDPSKAGHTPLDKGKTSAWIKGEKKLAIDVRETHDGKPALYGEYVASCAVYSPGLPPGTQREGLVSTKFTVRQPTATEVLDVRVTPASGTGAFQLAIKDKWFIAADKLMGEPIHIAYTTPGGNSVELTPYEPWADFGVPQASTDWEEDQQEIALNVTDANGVATPGDYSVKCWTDSQPQGLSASFTVQKPTLAMTLKLEEKMRAFSTGLAPTGYKKTPLDLVWGGDLVSGPDGSIDATLTGTYEGSVALTATNDTYAGDYGIHATFRVKVTGMVALTPTGLSVELSQAVVDYKVAPCTVISGSIKQADLDACTQAVVDGAPKLFSIIFTGLKFEGALPLTQDVKATAGGWTGTATLSAPASAQ